MARSCTSGKTSVAMYSRHIELSEYTTNMSFPLGSHKTQTSRYKAIRWAKYSVKEINASGRSATTSAAFQILRESIALPLLEA